MTITIARRLWVACGRCDRWVGGVTYANHST